MKVLVIHNPSAGMRTEQAQIDAAVRVMRSEGWNVELEETECAGHASELAREAGVCGYDSVYAAGGDGTVNEVLNGLVGTPTSLGVLPYGTANVWAKEMGLPLGDLAGATRLELNAKACSIDVGEARGEGRKPRAFVLWCGVGFDGHITAEIEPQRELKRRLGALMFWLVGLRTAFTFRGDRAQVSVDGRTRRGRILMALASNAQLYGGIVRVSPAAKIDDGLLDLAVFRGTGALTTGWHLLRVFLGWHLSAPDVRHYQARSIEIRARDLPVHVDGEPFGSTPVSISVRPKCLRVLVPRTANRGLFSNPIVS